MKKTLRKLNSLLAIFIVASLVSVTYGQISVLPVIDGHGDEAAWDVATAWPIEAVIDVDAVDDAADLSGSVKVMWSADSLYILCEVLDDTLYGGTSDAYKYDNIAIYIDVYNKASSSYLDSTQMYFEKNWWQDSTQIGGRLGTNWMAPPGNFKVSVINETGYTIELAYGWASAQKTPAIGDVVGFDVKLSDNDGPTPELENRDQIAWRDVTDGGWDNPSLWGEITLAADGSVTGMTEFDIAIDGVATERAWAPMASTSLTSIISTVGVENAADLSGNFKLKWDADYLYVLCIVKDDSLYFGTSDAYKYDNICVYVDAYNKKSTTFLDSTQVYFEKNWWVADHMGGRVGTNWIPPTGDWAADTIVPEYVLELAYPWATADKTPMVNDTIGFDVKLSDNDGGDGEIRDQITYMDITDGGWDNPSLWGEIKLLENGFVSAISMRPAKPAGLAVTAVDSVVSVAWTVVEGMTYNIYLGSALVGEGIATSPFGDTISQGAEDATYTYAIRAADADGVLSNATVKDVTILASTVGFDYHIPGNVSVYPNPANEVLNINSDEDIVAVNILSMTGQIIESKSVNARNTMIDVSNIQSGIYIVNVRLEKSSQYYRVFVR